MRGGPYVLLFALVACGDRTALESDLAGSDAGLGDAEGPTLCRGAPWLVFELARGSSTTLYAMRADGSEGHSLRLASHGGFPSFSADGTKLLYVTATAEADDGGYLQTLVVQQLTSGTTQQLATRLVQGDVEEETVSLTYSAFSPDGQTVAYTAGYDVRAVNIDGTGDHLVIGGSVNDNIVYGHPSFTEDSDTVLYGTSGAFGSVRLDGSANQTLVTQDGVGGPTFPNPTPSPDGSSVASVIQCASDAGTMLTALRVYPLASLPAPCESGVEATTLDDVFSAYNDSANPSWGPSGLIAYGSASDVWVVDPDGGAPRNMTRGLTGKTGAAFDPVWAPACAPIP
jgi:Tol biopolymer transport system component